MLGQAGIDTIVVDREEGTVAEARAVSIDDESLRTMQAIGLGPEILKDVVPGYGSQGGTATDVAAAFDVSGLGAVVNSSRGIIFAHQRANYAQQFAPHDWESAVAVATRDMIDDLGKFSALR